MDKNKGLNVAGFDSAQPATRPERSRRPYQRIDIFWEEMYGIEGRNVSLYLEFI